MAKKTKKVSITAFEEYVKATNPIVEKDIDVGGLTITVKNMISLEEMIGLVRGVVETCYMESGEYMPEARDLVTYSFILENYTNLSLPAGVVKRYELITGASQMVKAVLSEIDAYQLDSILRAIDDRIEMRNAANESAVAIQAKDTFSKIDQLATQLSSAFGSVDQDTVNAIVGALTDGGIDETRLMDAYLSYQSKTVEQ